MGPDQTTSGGRKVGELAEASGLTVRTLHHYEEIGLLVASQRTDAGHRRYTDADVARLYRISLLRRLGLSLAEIGKALDDPAWSLHSAMTAHLAQIDRRTEAMASLRARLTQLLGVTDPLTTDLLEVLDTMTKLDATVQRRISLLVYADIEAAFHHLIDVFGLGPGELTRDGEGNVVHGEVQAGDGVVWLHAESPEFGLASPKTLGSATASFAVIVDDVDAHYRHTVAKGGAVDYEPVDMPYGYREYGARDCEGHLWSFMTPLD